MALWEAAMKRELFVIAIIINFHYVTLNTLRGNVFEQLLKDWLESDGNDNFERRSGKTFHPLILILLHEKMSQKRPILNYPRADPFAIFFLR